MMLVDAIKSATSEHAVYFLVTAYVESLHHFHRSLGIPESVIDLPLIGAEDLQHRLELLRRESEAAGEGVVGPLEAFTVLQCALGRLRDLTDSSCALITDSESARKAA